MFGIRSLRSLAIMAALAMTAVSGCAAEDGVIDTEAGKIKFETVAKGLATLGGSPSSRTEASS